LTVAFRRGLFVAIRTHSTDFHAPAHPVTARVLPALIIGLALGIGAAPVFVGLLLAGVHPGRGTIVP
jgi:hypothetical protein